MAQVFLESETSLLELDFAKWVDVRLVFCGLTKTELATRLGVGRTTLYRALSDEGNGLRERIVEELSTG